MAFSDLQEFVSALDRDLRRVRARVDPHLEVTGIVQRVVREAGPALLFENPSRGRMPLLINAFGTRRRMAMALCVNTVRRDSRRVRPGDHKWSRLLPSRGWLR